MSCFPPSPFVSYHALERFRERAGVPTATVADVLTAIRGSAEDDSWRYDAAALRHLLMKHGPRQFRFLVDRQHKITFVLAENRAKFAKQPEVVLTCYAGTVAGGKGRRLTQS